MKLRSSLVVTLASFAACSGRQAAQMDTTTPAPPSSASAPGTVASASDTSAMLRGTIASVSSTNLVLKADTGSVTVALAPKTDVYDRVPATLADVKDNTFIGVTTVKQPDGTEQATEIHIFPEALRGLGEGSRMMAQGGGGNRMTNGSATASSASSGSRMSNGNVSGSTGSTFVVQYAGGSQKVVVPANTPVTKIEATAKPLAQGEKVVVLTKRNADGSLLANRVMLSR